MMIKSVFVVLSVAIIGWTEAANKPNFIIFYIDDLGYADLSPYGYPTSFTPNIRKLAENGLILTNFYTNSPVCSPSRAGLLTGRYQTRSGIYPGVFDPTDLGGLPFNETTIAEGLKEVGYSTGIVGKWHLGVGEDEEYLPHNHGFDYYLGIPYSHNDCPCYICYYPRGHCSSYGSPQYVPCPVYEIKNEQPQIIQQPANLTTLSENLLSAAKSFISNKAANKKPFFLYYSFHHTHSPQFAGQRFVNTSIRGPYGDSLREIDYSVGQIVKTLATLGLSNDTLIFITADNGPALEDGVMGGDSSPLRCGKGTTWEGGLRVPGIAYWPGKIQHRRSAQLASTLDLLPTIFKLSGAELPDDITVDGVDMSPILFKKGAKSNREIFAYLPEDANEQIGVYAFRWKNFKAHYYTAGGACSNSYPDEACRSNTTDMKHYPPILYNLHTDPGELYPLNPDYYSDIIQIINDKKDEFMLELEWNESQLKMGKDRSIQPCGNPGCYPFPYCCRVNILSPWQQEHFSWL